MKRILLKESELVNLIERVINEQVVVADPPCQKDCSQLLPQSWYDMVATKPCNFMISRATHMYNRMNTGLSNSTLELHSCQHRRIECKHAHLTHTGLQMPGCNMPTSFGNTTTV